MCLPMKNSGAEEPAMEQPMEPYAPMEPEQPEENHEDDDIAEL